VEIIRSSASRLDWLNVTPHGQRSLPRDTRYTPVCRPWLPRRRVLLIRPTGEWLGWRACLRRASAACEWGPLRALIMAWSRVPVTEGPVSNTLPLRFV
jgi:hypothetical protein